MARQGQGLYSGGGGGGVGGEGGVVCYRGDVASCHQASRNLPVEPAGDDLQQQPGQGMMRQGRGIYRGVGWGGVEGVGKG